MNEPPPLPPGTRLGPYVLGAPLGTGATAIVYRGRDAHGRVHAVKVRRSGVVALDRRFLREFEAMRSLRLPGVVRVYEAGITEDLIWFSMDLIEGQPFLEAVHAYPDVPQRIRITAELGRQLLDILASLHQAGFVHRDIKPPNVLVDRERNVRVLDFGIARFFGEGDAATGSDSGQILGTVPFMSPEQLAGLPFDQRVDLFATGLVLYEAIDGFRPRPSTSVGWIQRICMERLVPLACKHREVPRGLSRVIERLLAVDPAERPTAQEAANELRRVLAGGGGGDWPEPPWVEVGETHDLEGCIGNTQLPAVMVLEGPIGAGRRRLAEQVHRVGVLQGVWPVHIPCYVDGVGRPVARLLETLLAANDDPAWRAEVVQDDAETLRKMWPTLPLPASTGTKALHAMSDIAQAAARCVTRVANRRPLLIVVHNLDEVDDLTAQTLLRVGMNAGARLGILLLHEARWSTTRSRQLVANLRMRGAGIRTVSPLDADAAQQVAAALCPNAPPTDVSAGTAQDAVEAGLEALARWRGEPFPAPDDRLWPLVLRPMVPEPVFVRIAGKDLLQHPLIRVEEGNVSIAGEHAWRLVAARLSDPMMAARTLASAWTEAMGDKADPGELATLWLRAGDFQAAARPVLAAAAEAEAEGRYRDARRWLIVLDTIVPETSAERAFEHWYVRAQVVLRTEAGLPRIAFIENAERAVRTIEEDQLAKILRAEYQIRAGEVRPALVAALRVASPAMSPPPHVAVRALLVATEARFLLGHFSDARPQLERAKALLTEHPHPRLEVQTSNLLAELLHRTGDLGGARRLLQDTIRRASSTRYIRAAAVASGRLGAVLRMLGKRQEAEHQVRSARDAFLTTADQDRVAESGLDLAVLRAERGDAASARHLTDESLRRVQGTASEDVLAKAMRVALIVATLRADTHEAALAIETLEQSRDPEAPAVLVRWWRSRGDVERAMNVHPPPPGTYGASAWRIERARAALAAGDPHLAASEARSGLQVAARSGFAELALYAKLVHGVARPGDDNSWRELQRHASGALFTEVCLGAIELDARRTSAKGDIEGARAPWRSLKARAEELGYAPGIEEATGWLNQADRGSRGGT